MKKLAKGGITIEVGDTDMDFYVRAGYKIVEETQAVEPTELAKKRAPKK